MGGFDSRTPVLDEPPLGYHPSSTGTLTRGLESGLGTLSGGQFDLNQVLGHCQAGSLTGAVASQKVTEALKGSLSTVGNRA